jgi:chromosome segregation ATPase
VTLKTTIDNEGEVSGSRSAYYHDAKVAHELQAAYTAALTELEASDSDQQKLKARVAELEALCQTIGKQSTEYATKVGYAEGRAMGLEYRVKQLEAELAKERSDG